MRLVLASQSPRRRELLASVGLAVVIRPANADESVHAGEAPEAYVRRVARDKAGAVEAAAGELVLAADTAVVLDGAVLGKPADDAEARRMLRALSGRTHVVMTGVHARAHPAEGGAPREGAVMVSTAVRFRPLADRQIDWYVATGEPADKAGAYAVQGIGGALVAGVAGSVSNVVGLPLAETLALLARLGLPSPWERSAP
jgi:septum formation protein